MPERTVKTALELRHIRSSPSTNLPSLYLDPFLRCFATRKYAAVVDKAKFIYVYENRDIKYESERNSSSLCSSIFYNLPSVDVVEGVSYEVGNNELLLGR